MIIQNLSLVSTNYDAATGALRTRYHNWHNLHTIYLTMIEQVVRVTTNVHQERATLDAIKSYISNTEALGREEADSDDILMADAQKTESSDTHLRKLISKNSPPSHYMWWYIR